MKKMKKWIQSHFKSVNQDFLFHTTYYILLTTLLLIAFFLRVYRQSDLLGFYYDQGRDALVIWNLWHEGKLFLVGPVTGLEGIFLGPFYYYLIAPFYLLGKGNPIYPAIFLAFLSTVAIYMLYILGTKIHSRRAGFIAVIIATFSYYIVLAGRWLSNPTPIMLSSTLLLFFVIKLIETGKNNYWIGISLLLGLSLHFESASAVFYLPILTILFLWIRFSRFGKENKIFPSTNIIIISSVVFLLTLIPQLAFNFRHDNLLLNNFERLFFIEKSFKPNFWVVLPTRLSYFWEVFHSKIMPGNMHYVIIAGLLSLFGLIVSRNPNFVKFGRTILLTFLITPMFGYILFQGNSGNIYDYYMTGYYLPMILLFSIGLAEISKNKVGMLLVSLFLIAFVMLNTQLLKNNLTRDLDNETLIVLGNQIKSIDTVLKNSNGEKFNIDYYVPPVIPHSFEYMMLWRSSILCGDDRCGLIKSPANILYTLYEVDPPHPERLSIWLSKYEKTTIVVEEDVFGGIHVQKRIRL